MFKLDLGADFQPHGLHSLAKRRFLQRSLYEWLRVKLEFHTPAYSQQPWEPSVGLGSQYFQHFTRHQVEQGPPAKPRKVQVFYPESQGLVYRLSLSR